MALEKVHKRLKTVVGKFKLDSQRRILKNHLFDLMPISEKQLELIKGIRIQITGYSSIKFELQKRPLK